MEEGTVLELKGKNVDVTYKVLLLGNTKVGKSALMSSLVGKECRPQHIPTVGIDFVKKTFSVNGANVQLEIWDTAGQQQFRSITVSQFSGTKGVLLVYDVTDRLSFDSLEIWFETIDSELDGKTNDPIPVVLVANKTDQEDKRVISEEMGQQRADSAYVHAYVETSAKMGTNVQKAFGKLAYAVTEIFNRNLMNMYQDEKVLTKREDLSRRQCLADVKFKQEKKKKSKKKHTSCSCFCLKQKR